jgi:hypothetical protein
MNDQNLTARPHYRYKQFGMFVYGIRCTPMDLINLPTIAADYYLEHELLVFPSYTVSSTYMANGFLTSSFWTRVQQLLQDTGALQIVDLEHPYISEEEYDCVKNLQCFREHTKTHWFYVPRISARNMEEFASYDSDPK